MTLFLEDACPCPAFAVLDAELTAVRAALVEAALAGGTSRAGWDRWRELSGYVLPEWRDR